MVTLTDVDQAITLEVIEEFVAVQAMRPGNSAGVRLNYATQRFLHYHFHLLMSEWKSERISKARVFVTKSLPAGQFDLGHLWGLLKRQPVGQDGLLYTDGRRNICRLKNRPDLQEGDRFLVFYYDRGWFLDSLSVKEATEANDAGHLHNAQFLSIETLTA